VSSDRNLLFGILALQLDFVSRDALITAMHAWVLAKQRPLGEILVEQAALSTDDREALETIVEKHLHQHGGHTQGSLAAVSIPLELRESLHQIADGDLEASVLGLSTANDSWRTGPFVPSEPSSTGTPTLGNTRFQIVRPHAHGGLGEVFVAHDGELNRQVALKEIQNKYADDAQSRARFLLEAEITGGLEHPAIVPVYGLGRHPDGRPYYAMRFIEGDSLKDAIDSFHAAEGPKRDPGQRVLELRKLLDRFLDVCQAIAYAHSRGVLHRDLKPPNIMLGPYGETLVVDWGLAKAGVGAQESEVSKPAQSASIGSGRPLLHPASADDVAATQLGSVLGTPAFMSPEQAAGQLDLLGPASDIYGLGATLYCLLTGQAPFAGTERAEVLAKVQRGEFLAPRQMNRSVPPALDAICRKAMALRPEDRYAKAKGLAEDIEHWLADEPVMAYREPLRARASRWARRHKPLVAGSTAVLLSALLLGGGFLIRDQQRRDGQRVMVNAYLLTARDALRQERWSEADLTLGSAQGRLGDDAPADLEQELRQLRKDLTLVRRLEFARLERANAVRWGAFDDAGADQAFSDAFGEYDLDLETLDADECVGRIHDALIRRQLVEALDEWTFIKDNLRPAGGQALRAIARRADDDPWRQRLRDPAVRGDRAALEELAKDASALSQSVAHLVQLSRALREAGAADTAKDLLRNAQASHPDDFWTNFALAIHLDAEQPRSPAEAVGFYRAALTRRPDAFPAWMNLGRLLPQLGRPGEAVAAYKKATGLQPKSEVAHLSLGDAWSDQKEPAMAEAAFREAIAIKHDYVDAYNRLGNLLASQRRWPEAEGAYRRALEIDPKNGETSYNLAFLLAKEGKSEEAIAAYQQTIQHAPGHARAHTNLGGLLAVRENLPEADKLLRESLRLQPDLVEASINLGSVLTKQGKPAEAVELFRKAIAGRPEIFEAHFSLAIALEDLGKNLEAIEAYCQAIARRPDHAGSWFNMGLLLQKQKDHKRAEEAFCQTIKQAPRNAHAHGALGQALLDQGRFAEAREATEHALSLLSPADRFYVRASHQLRKCEEMLALDEKLPAVLMGKVKPKDAAEAVELASICSNYKKRYADAARLYADALAAQPKRADDIEKGVRYDAACAAALAGCGQCEDASKLDEKERARLRRQALTWLRTYLSQYAQLVEKNDAKARVLLQQRMLHWKQDAAFAGVRGDPIAMLPEAERQEWHMLWDDVEILRNRTAEPK
jgi:serine/threonine protein kinase/Tfp pilus assembly protein PilF